MVKQFQNLNFNLNLCDLTSRGVSSIKNKCEICARTKRQTKRNFVRTRDGEIKNKKVNEYRRHKINRQKKKERTERKKIVA